MNILRPVKTRNFLNRARLCLHWLNDATKLQERMKDKYLKVINRHKIWEEGKDVLNFDLLKVIQKLHRSTYERIYYKYYRDNTTIISILSSSIQYSA